MGGVGICYVNTFLMKVGVFPGGTPLTMSLTGGFLTAGSHATRPVCPEYAGMQK